MEPSCPFIPVIKAVLFSCIFVIFFNQLTVSFIPCSNGVYLKLGNNSLILELSEGF